MGVECTKPSYTEAWNAHRYLSYTEAWPKSLASTRGFHPILRISLYGIFFSKVLIKKSEILGGRPFFKIINMSTAHHINNQIKLGSYATITSTANYIQNQVKNILTNYPKSPIAHILSKQKILDGLKKSGFSPRVWSRVLLYETIDLFEVYVQKNSKVL